MVLGNIYIYTDKLLQHVLFPGLYRTNMNSFCCCNRVALIDSLIAFIISTHLIII